MNIECVTSDKYFNSWEALDDCRENCNILGICPYVREKGATELTQAEVEELMGEIRNYRK